MTLVCLFATDGTTKRQRLTTILAGSHCQLDVYQQRVERVRLPFCRLQILNNDSCDGERYFATLTGQSWRNKLANSRAPNVEHKN
jgi:hypothetical protein